MLAILFTVGDSCTAGFKQSFGVTVHLDEIVHSGICLIIRLLQSYYHINVQPGEIFFQGDDVAGLRIIGA
ncbi:hypothetical protein D3C80_1321180 [compost metagenome]